MRNYFIKITQGKITKGLIIQKWKAHGKVTQELPMDYPRLDYLW